MAATTRNHDGKFYLATSASEPELVPRVAGLQVLPWIGPADFGIYEVIIGALLSTAALPGTK